MKPSRELFVVAKHYLAQLQDAWAVKLAVAGAAAGLEYILPTDVLKSSATALLVLIVIDWLTGILASVKESVRITSARMREGVIKHIGYALLVIAASVMFRTLDSYLAGVQLTPAALAVMLVYLGATEFKSVLENLGRMGVKVPKWARSFARAMVKKFSEEGPKLS